MKMMAPSHPAELQMRRVRLPAGLTAPAEARSEVRTAISAWDIPVDPDIAVLLTSDLVTNAIRHEQGESVTLGIRCSSDRLRIDVLDTSRTLPVLLDTPTDSETGRGLMLVATLSAEWGFYRTPAGKAVYFTLAFESEPTTENGSGVGTVSGHSPSPACRPR